MLQNRLRYYRNDPALPGNYPATTRTRHYPELPGLPVLPGTTRYYLVQPGTTWYYPVLPGTNRIAR
eukprot:652025-Amorphochlora_amoeboformis.AAC.1